MRTMEALIFTRNKNHRNYSVNQSIDGLKTFQAMDIARIFSFFQLGASFCM